MAIGRLSIRSKPGNRLHHLYRDNGSVFWVNYTLYFDFRKRRIRRSLGTTCPETTIRLRDELFARLAAEGEEIEERPIAHVSPRTCRVMKADVGLRAAEAHLARGDIVGAAKLYDLTAGRFRHADLGLLAKQCWTAAAECWAQGGHEARAEQCRTAAKGTPTYWEEPA